MVMVTYLSQKVGGDPAKVVVRQEGEREKGDCLIEFLWFEVWLKFRWI